MLARCGAAGALRTQVKLYRDRNEKPLSRSQALAASRPDDIARVDFFARIGVSTVAVTALPDAGHLDSFDHCERLGGCPA